MSASSLSAPVILLVPPSRDGCAWLDRSLSEVVAAAGSADPEVVMAAITAAQCGERADYVATSTTNGERAQLCLRHAAAARMHPATNQYVATLRTR